MLSKYSVSSGYRGSYPVGVELGTDSRNSVVLQAGLRGGRFIISYFLPSQKNKWIRVVSDCVRSLFCRTSTALCASCCIIADLTSYTIVKSWKSSFSSPIKNVSMKCVFYTYIYTSAYWVNNPWLQKSILYIFISLIVHVCAILHSSYWWLRFISKRLLSHSKPREWNSFFRP